MPKIFLKYLIIGFGFLAVAYPLWFRLQTLSWINNIDVITANLFPFFGLAMVALLWLHSMMGAFEPWLRQYIPFDPIVEITAFIILICLIIHPLLLLISMKFMVGDIFLYYGLLSVWLGIISWLLLISYDVIKPFKKRAYIAPHWNKVLFISNLGFLLSFFHALNLGSDLQTNPLRNIWIFYGITATLAILYTYAIKPFLKK